MEEIFLGWNHSGRDKLMEENFLGWNHFPWL